MDNFLHVVSQLQSVFGAAIVVPIILFIVALFLKVKPKAAFMSALSAGIGLTGYGWIIGSFTPTASAVIKKLVESTGVEKQVFDNGWQTGATASFNSSPALAFFVIALVAQFILYALKVTKIFVPSNLWNNFGYMVWGAMAFYVTKNWWIAIGLMTFLMLWSLVLSEMMADRWSDYYGVKNATINSLHNTEQFVPAVILDPIFNLLGFNKVKFNPTAFKEKLGVFGEPTVLGAILGLIIGFLANLGDLNKMEAWGQILGFAVQLAAVMTIFPLVTGVFASAFQTLGQAVEDNRRKDGEDETEEKSATLSNKRWFVGVDDGVGFGEPATIIAGTILIPIMVVLAFALPGNKTIPVVDLIALPFMVQPFIALSKGNMLKAIVGGIIWFSLGLYMASYLAPMYTGMLKSVGIALPAGVLLLTSFNLIARPLNGLIFLAFISMNPLWIGIAVAVYLVSFVLLRTRRAQIWTYLENMANKNVGYEQTVESKD
ncbi:MAG: PTS galactitol transporter subunit IIC [Lactobacillaceae bacterium]|jgi:PTS system galactitol-specific IIC component|nr:PTS galactitol transporter subunit IIC [Lactobacillaceae bacterium]